MHSPRFAAVSLPPPFAHSLGNIGEKEGRVGVVSHPLSLLALFNFSSENIFCASPPSKREASVVCQRRSDHHLKLLITYCLLLCVLYLVCFFACYFMPEEERFRVGNEEASGEQQGSVRFL